MSRIFVIDPVCAMEYGHSLNAIKYFGEMARSHNPKTYMVASRHLPGRQEDDDIIRFFEFHYDRVLKIDRLRPANTWAQQLGSTQNPRALSAADFCRFLVEYDVTREDVFLFPSADYYGLIGALSALTGLAPEKTPKLMLRLIGVMENGALDNTTQNSFSDVVRSLNSYIAVGGDVSVCAETPKYAKRLNAVLDCDVTTLPYFSPAVQGMPSPKDGPITFLAGGSARPDKGFFRLGDIIRKVHQKISPSQVKFVIQGLPETDVKQHVSYLRSLVSLPNAKLLPGQISYDEIQNSFAESHVGLMPYDAEIYEWRGSAMLMESMLFQRMVICQADTGFADQARYYGAGDVCKSDDDFAEAICFYAALPPERILAQAALSREFYLQDVKAASSAWMGEQL